MSTINLLLIPFQRQGIIALPKTLVEYVLPYALPLPSDYQDPALVAAIIYKNEKIPVLDVAYLFDPKGVDKSEDEVSMHRIVIVSCITDKAQSSSYAIIARGAPRILEIDEEGMEEINDTLPPMMHNKISLGHDYYRQIAYIPNVEKIESEILI